MPSDLREPLQQVPESFEPLWNALCVVQPVYAQYQLLVPEMLLDGRHHRIHMRKGCPPREPQCVYAYGKRAYLGFPAVDSDATQMAVGANARVSDKSADALNKIPSVALG